MAPECGSGALHPSASDEHVTRPDDALPAQSSKGAVVCGSYPGHVFELANALIDVPVARKPLASMSPGLLYDGERFIVE